MITINKHLESVMRKCFLNKLIVLEHPSLGFMGFGGEYIFDKDGKGVLHYTPIVENIPQWNTERTISDNFPDWENITVSYDQSSLSLPPRDLPSLWFLWMYLRWNRSYFDSNPNGVGKSFNFFIKGLRYFCGTSSEQSKELVRVYAMMLADVFDPEFASEWSVADGMMGNGGLPDAREIIKDMSLSHQTVPEFYLALNNIRCLINAIDKI